jgi:Leucine-rich repeat (LRR) protein
MKRIWTTANDVYNDMKNMETFNQIKILTIYGKIKFSLQFSLPNKLIKLYCSNNQLTNLPELPNTLTRLDCSNNQLTNLPELPNTLTRLDCDDNQLSSLPKLPNTLTCLDCSYNQLSSLPELPNTLTYLFCDNNQLSSLPILPKRLSYAAYDNNPFNLWAVLIDPTKINMEYAEIIYEKLNILDYKIKEIECELNENRDEEDKLNKNEIDQYNKNMSELKIEIDKILNFKLDIIL